jgi:flavin-binding protein dodecin
MHPCWFFILLILFKEGIMSDSVYKIIDLVGSSQTSWEDAASKAIKKAANTLKDLRIAEVQKLDIKIEDGKPMTFRTNLRLSFKYKDE